MFNSALAGGLFNSPVEQRRIENAGTYFISELERLDPKLNQPLVQFTHTRDIDLREDITIGDTDASFQFSTLGGAGGPDQNGYRYSWVAGNTTNIPAINANVNKVKQDLMLWAQVVQYNIQELAASQQQNRPIDQIKIDNVILKENMDTDRMVYLGDENRDAHGLATNKNIEIVKAVNPYKPGITTPEEALSQIVLPINMVYNRSGTSISPNRLLLPPSIYVDLVTKQSNNAASNSLITYLKENNLYTSIIGDDFGIYPVKWLENAGTNGGRRCIAYYKNKDFIRFPKVPLQRSQPQWHQLWFETTFFSKMGMVEFIYPETVAYMDGF